MKTKRGDWMNLNCGDLVVDVRDPRHEGRVEFLSNGTARVRWTITGWLSEHPVENLRCVSDDYAWRVGYH